MNEYLNCYDRSMRKVAILQNAYNIEETQEINQLYQLTFSIPADDVKTEFLQAFCYIRWNEDGQLYRIKNRSYDYRDDSETLRIECEHVFATLLDNVMFGEFTYGGGTVKTSDTIDYILGMQSVQNWVLDGCDFDRRFEYTWHHETLLNALLNIPKEFGEDYMWDFNTSVYPWRLYLRKLDGTILPEFYIRAEQNLLGSTDDRNFTSIFTRIYGLGGTDEEGNQLTIESVNDGLPYLEAPADIIQKYGLIEYILIDQRFTNPETLKAYMSALLTRAVEPGMSRSFDVVDLYPLTNSDINRARVGALTKFTRDNTVVFITKTTRVLDEPGNLNIEFATYAGNLTDIIIDLSEAVHIQSAYT